MMSCSSPSPDGDGLLTTIAASALHHHQNDRPPPPPKTARRRSSYGGTNGIWWNVKGRKKATTTTSSSSATAATSTTKPSAATTNNIPSSSSYPEVIGWDDDLCRPIYSVVAAAATTSASSSSDENDKDDDDFGTNFDDDDHRPKEETKKTEKKESKAKLPLPTKKRRKPSKTYGNRKRRPLSLLMLDAGVHSHVSADGPSSITSPVTPKPPSLSPRRVSLDYNPNNNRNKNTAASGSVFDFDNDNENESQMQQQQQQHRPLTPFLETPLRNAKAYFHELDSNHPLKVVTTEEASAKKEEQVWRTSYKINMKSPGLQQEYSQYVSNLQGLGVKKPLSLQDYVEGRRDFFRKGELYNGFFDD